MNIFKSKMHIVRNLLLAAVAGIVLLHAAIPHSHHAEMTREQHQYSHQEANGLLDQVGLIFQEGHHSSLELYEKEAVVSHVQATDQVFHFAGAVLTFPSGEEIISEHRASEKASDISFPTVHPFSNGWRAPPL